MKYLRHGIAFAVVVGVSLTPLVEAQADESSVGSCGAVFEQHGDLALLRTPQGDVPITGDTSDPFYTTYSDSGDIYRVEVWRADATMTAPSSEELESLAEESLQGAGAPSVGEAEESIDLTAVSVPEVSRMVAVRVTGPDSSELSVYDAAGTGATCTTAPVRLTTDVELTALDGSRFMFTSDQPQPSGRAANDWNLYYHRTFIPAAKANSVVCGVFKGDNRTWSTSLSASHRTQVTARIDWAAKKFTMTRLVGTTHRLAEGGFGAASKTASVSGIKITGVSASSTYGRFEITHSVGNPLCSLAGPISYHEVVSMYKTGALSVQGSGVQVPNHEWYAMKANASVRTIQKTTAKDFFCLSVNCGNLQILKSVA